MLPYKEVMVKGFQIQLFIQYHLEQFLFLPSKYTSLVSVF